MSRNAPLDRRGVAAAVSAYVMWGVFPLYWYLLRDVPALQIIAHRVIWCGVFVVGYLVISERLAWWHKLRVVPRIAPMLLASSVLISVNWGLYIWAVTHGHVVESSLGYFINPLVSVLLGVLVLRERLNRWQWLAVSIAAAGVLWLALIHGRPPWIALALAFSFAFYGLIRKTTAVDAMPGLAVESLILLIPAVLWLLWSKQQAEASFLHGRWQRDGLLVLGGLLTALPLIGFTYAARRIPYSLIGFLQYLSPSIQLGCGVVLLDESFSRDQAVGFACIWIALLLYAGDGLLRAKRSTQPGSTLNSLE